MSSIQGLVLVSACTLLVVIPTRSQADAPNPTTATDLSSHADHLPAQRAVPECPHCRKTASLPVTPPRHMALADGNADASNASQALSPEPATAQKLTPMGPASPETNRAPELSPAIVGQAPTPALASQVPVAVPRPAPSSPADPGSTGEPDSNLPRLPDDLLEEDPPFMVGVPARPGSSADGVPSPPGSSSADRQMPAPVFLPVDKELEAFLADPPEPPAPPEPSPAPPTPGVYPFLNSNPEPILAEGASEGPSVRILSSPPSSAPLAMPPPPADPLENQLTGERFDLDEEGRIHSHLNGFSYLPVMLGDQSPPSGLVMAAVPLQASVAGQPPTPPSPFARPARMARPVALVPWARGFKIADNQSPMPQDRAFYTFDYFNNMNGDINRRLGSPINSMQVYRQLLGIEKTFWRGNASIGVRLPIDTLWTSSASPAWRGNSTAVGDVTVFTKVLLYDNPTSGHLLSGGLAVTAPTGPSSFAGSQTAYGVRSTQLQPFLGYVLRRGDFYLQGFSAIDIPTDSRDVTTWYNDLAVGYFVYQSADPSAWLSAVVPTFEVHLNDPLNHRGALRPNDPAGTPDVLDLTFGSSFILRKRLVATFGCSFPVTGPRPFDVEALALLNFYYGRYGMAQPWPMPPVSR